MFLHLAVSHSVYGGKGCLYDVTSCWLPRPMFLLGGSAFGGWGLHPGGGDLHPEGGKGSASRGRKSASRESALGGLHPGRGFTSRGSSSKGGGGLHPEGTGSASRGREDCIQGGLGRHPLEPEKWAVHILLECFLVTIFSTQITEKSYCKNTKKCFPLQPCFHTHSQF